MSRFQIGEIVVLKSDRSIRGAVVGIEEQADNLYRVFTGAGLQSYYESQIESEEVQSEIETVGAERFNANITASLIRNPSLSSLYTLANESV